MDVSLVDWGVGRKEIYVAFPFAISDVDAFGVVNNNREGTIIMASIMLFKINALLWGEFW